MSQVMTAVSAQAQRFHARVTGRPIPPTRTAAMCAWPDRPPLTWSDTRPGGGGPATEDPERRSAGLGPGGPAIRAGA